nr:RecName: Full=Omega-ctenitoxin-Pb1a; Short=Omega-CNTX-Pb1a; AltName: Full=Omega-ctenitoxin-Pb48 [Phoneutria boliviensis]
CDLAMGNCICK